MTRENISFLSLIFFFFYYYFSLSRSSAGKPANGATHNYEIANEKKKKRFINESKNIVAMKTIFKWLLTSCDGVFAFLNSSFTRILPVPIIMES